MSNDAFIALDFETANGKRTSICAVGMVKVVNHQITESFYTLVNPNDYFSQQNIAVHSIHPEQVEDAPTFQTVYPY
ncbi:exonuclease domain-containing protein, partial [Staphylococcus epidermidis]